MIDFTNTGVQILIAMIVIPAIALLVLPKNPIK